MTLKTSLRFQTKQDRF